MQRTTNSYPLRSVSGETGKAVYRQGSKASSQDESTTPLMSLARRIREEQGVEGLKEFLCAMKPYSAPNEIKRTGESFGISFESLKSESSWPEKQDANIDARKQIAQNGKQSQNNNQIQTMQMIQKIMLMQNLLSSGGSQAQNGIDANSLMKLIGGISQQN